MSSKIDRKQIKKRQFKLALFDLDGTLIDSAPDLAAAVDHSLTAMGLPTAGIDKVRSWVGNGAPVLINRALAYAQQCQPEEIAAQTSKQAYRYFLNYYRANLVVDTRLYQGVKPLLQHWAQAPALGMGIVTNKPGEFTAPICKQLDIDRFFDLMYSGDTFPVRKPNPLPLQKACETMGTTVEQTIMIGDSNNDLIAARQAGMTAVCVTYGYNHGGNIADLEPDVLVDSFQELM